MPADLALDIVDRIVALLDERDGDPDAEDGGDAEPALGPPEGHGSQGLRFRGTTRDLELDQPLEPRGAMPIDTGVRCAEQVSEPGVSPTQRQCGRCPMQIKNLALAGPLALLIASTAVAQTPRMPPKIDEAQVTEHMEVIGADARHIGTVDRVEPGKIKLTKDDPASGGVHHFIPFAWVDALADGKVRLQKSASEAMAAWN